MSDSLSTLKGIIQITGSMWIPVFIFVILALCSGIHAEEPMQNGKGDSNISADQIFSDIMKTLPKELKSKVENAKEIMKNHDNPETVGTEKKINNKTEEQKQKALGSLPDDVKIKVEKVIKEMNGRLKERQGELKELNK